MRREADDARNVAARYHWWMMANHLKSEAARAAVETGRSAVLESYFARTIATHQAMGHDSESAYPKGVLLPDVAVLLVVDEKTRRSRLLQRQESGGFGYWYQREEPNVAVTVATYERFGLTVVDATGLAPHEAAAEVAGIVHSVT